MPLRSAGCFLCRKRKIRCDETRPHCKKCATHGVACPGYRTEEKGGIEFKDQTGLTAQRAELQYKARQSRKGDALGFAVEPVAAATTTALLPHETFTDLVSPAMMRTQLYSTFMHIYLPRKQARLDHFSFYELVATQPCTDATLLESLDALSLVTVGSLSKDKAVLDQSVWMYGRALYRLRKAIARPGALQNDNVLAATTVLAQAALYEEIGRYSQGWQQHTSGCQQLIAMRGPESLQSELALLIFSSLRHGALCAALIMRKAPFMALPEWRAKAMATHVPGEDWSTLFYDAAIQVPGLLEQYDDLGPGVATGETTAAQLDDLLAACYDVEGSMRKCMASWQESALLDEPWTFAFEEKGSFFHAERPIEEFVPFCSVVTDRTFEFAFAFPSFPIAYLASLYWMCMHFLQTTVQRLHKLRHDVDHDWYPPQEREVQEDELLELVLNLCKTIPFFCEPIAGSTGHIGIFLPMRTAAIYFTQRGHWKYARWIGVVRNSVFTKGLAPPNVRDPPGTIPKPKAAQSASKLSASEPSFGFKTTNELGHAEKLPAGTYGKMADKAMLAEAWRSIQAMEGEVIEADLASSSPSNYGSGYCSEAL